MANEILLKNGTQTRFFVSGSFSPADPGTNWSAGTPNDYALTLGSVADGAGRQSIKSDLGATWARRHVLLATVDYTSSTPVIGQSVDYYWAPSTSATTGNANVAGNSGNDAAAPDGAVGGITLDEFIRQCVRIGQLIVHDGASVQNGYAGMFTPPTRWGQLIVVNNGGAAFATGNAEAHHVLVPLIDEVQ